MQIAIASVRKPLIILLDSINIALSGSSRAKAYRSMPAKVFFRVVRSLPVNIDVLHLLIGHCSELDDSSNLTTFFPVS